MKKAKSIFVVLAAALCIGSITYTSFNQKETQFVSAGDFTDNSNDENSEVLTIYQNLSF